MEFEHAFMSAEETEKMAPLLLDEIAPFSDKYTQHILILQKVLESYGTLDRVGGV